MSIVGKTVVPLHTGNCDSEVYITMYPLATNYFKSLKIFRHFRILRIFWRRVLSTTCIEMSLARSDVQPQHSALSVLKGLKTVSFIYCYPQSMHIRSYLYRIIHKKKIEFWESFRGFWESVKKTHITKTLWQVGSKQRCVW